MFLPSPREIFYRSLNNTCFYFPLIFFFFFHNPILFVLAYVFITHTHSTEATKRPMMLTFFFFFVCLDLIELLDKQPPTLSLMAEDKGSLDSDRGWGSKFSKMPAQPEIQ